MVVYAKSCFLFQNILVFKDAQLIKKKNQYLMYVWSEPMWL